MTPEERASREALRAWCTGALDGLAGDARRCPAYITWLRHECREQTAASRSVESGTWAMALRQHYWHLDGTKFGFAFRQGRCPRCQLHVVSYGRFVRTSENAPEKGAVVAHVQPHGDVPSDQGSAALAP